MKRCTTALLLALPASTASAQALPAPARVIEQIRWNPDPRQPGTPLDAASFRLLELRRDGHADAVALATDPNVSTTAGPVPGRIDVPAWMQPQTPPISLASSSGSACEESAYRPSGLLDRRSEARRHLWYASMASIACAHGLPISLFDALIIAESGYDAMALSPMRASGLTQLMPATAAGLGVNRFDPVDNLRGGALYLRRQLDRFGQVHLALGAYNAGPGRIRNRRLPAISETLRYVDRILENWRRLERGTVEHDAGLATAPRSLRQSGAIVVIF